MNPFVKFLSNVKWTLPFFVAGSAIFAARMSFRPGESVSAFDLSPQGDVVFTGTSMGQISAWELGSLKKITTINVPCQVKSLGVSRNGKSIIYGGQSGEVGLLKFENKQLSIVKKIRLPCDEVLDVTFSEKGSYCAAASVNYAKAFLMDDSLNVVNSMFQPGNGVSNPFISETNDYIAHSGQVFWVWNLDKVKKSKYKNAECHSPEAEKLIKECLRTQLGGSAAIEVLPFKDYRKGLYIGTYTGDPGTPCTVALWDVSAGTLEPILKKQEPMTGGDLSPDNTLFAVASRTGKVRVFTLADKKQVAENLFTADIPATEIGLTFPIERVRFVKDKPQLLCLTVDSRLFIWNFKTGRIQQLS